MVMRRRRALGYNEGPAYLLDAVISDSAGPGTGALTNTRASAQTVVDHNGIYHQSQNNELCYIGLRRGRNLFVNSDAPVTQSITTVATTYVLQASGTGTLTLSGTGAGSLVVAGNHKRLAFTATAGTLTITLSAGTPTWVQLIRTTGATDPTAPWKYISSTTMYNAGVAGVEYFTTTNGYTADGGGVVTEGAGTAITNAWRGLDTPYTSTNSATYCEDLTNAAWTKDGVTAVNDGTLGPDGIGQLQKVTDTTGNVVHRIYHAADFSTGTQAARTVHIMSGGTIPFVRVSVGGANLVYADIDCATMTVAASGASGTATLRSAYIERLGLSNIYVVRIAGTFSATQVSNLVVDFCQSVGVTTAYVGTLQYAYMGFKQAEARTEASPYIPNKTTGSTTRSANTTTAALSGLTGGQDLAMIITHRPYYAPSQTAKTAYYQAGRIGSVVNDSLVMHISIADASVYAVKKIAAANSISLSTGLTEATARTKWGFRVTGGKMRLCVNGTLATENANTTAATNDNVLTLVDTNSVFERIEIYRRTMSDTELQARTT